MMQRYKPTVRNEVTAEQFGACYVAEMIRDDNGEWCKVADVQPVPEPSPWLDQPDGLGWFWLLNPKYPAGVHPTHVPYVHAINLHNYVGRKWQRIPQPSLPGEGGNDDA